MSAWYTPKNRMRWLVLSLSPSSRLFRSDWFSIQNSFWFIGTLIIRGFLQIKVCDLWNVKKVKLIREKGSVWKLVGMESNQNFLSSWIEGTGNMVNLNGTKTVFKEKLEWNLLLGYPRKVYGFQFKLLGLWIASEKKC